MMPICDTVRERALACCDSAPDWNPIRVRMSETEMGRQGRGWRGQQGSAAGGEGGGGEVSQGGRGSGRTTGRKGEKEQGRGMRRRGGKGLRMGIGMGRRWEWGGEGSGARFRARFRSLPPHPPAPSSPPCSLLRPVASLLPRPSCLPLSLSVTRPFPFHGPVRLSPPPVRAPSLSSYLEGL